MHCLQEKPKNQPTGPIFKQEDFPSKESLSTLDRPNAFPFFQRIHFLNQFYANVVVTAMTSETIAHIFKL